MEYLKQFIYLKFKMPIIQEYKHNEEFLILMAFLDFFGLENPIGIFSIELYPDFIEAFHNWHKRINLKNYNFPCC
ncbi:MAG: hypothetical protein ABIL49_06110 [candidate division WOR-3 bacterium]|jgi:hypothetical protein